MRTLLCICCAVVLSSSLRAQQDQFLPSTTAELFFANAQLTLPFDIALFSRDSAVMYLRSRFHPNADVDGLLLSTRDGVTWHARLKFFNVGFISMGQLQEEIPRLDLLSELRRTVHEENKQRELEGYQTVAITRIIEPPQLDAQRRLLEFAIETLQDTLFSIERHLFFFGARGFLHAAVSIPQGFYPVAKPWSTEIFSTFAFNAGSRYDDRDPSVTPEADGGFSKAFLNVESEGGGWFLPTLVILLIIASIGLLYYDRLFPKKKQKVVPRKKSHTTVTKTPVRRL